MTVLVDEMDAEGAIARSYADAPEIDGNVFIDGAMNLKPGQFVEVEITEFGEHDLWGRVLKPYNGKRGRTVAHLTTTRLSCVFPPL